MTVGHGNLIRAAIGTYAAEGGSGVYVLKPGAEHGFELGARIAPEDWLRLAE